MRATFIIAAALFAALTAAPVAALTPKEFMAQYEPMMAPVTASKKFATVGDFIADFKATGALAAKASKPKITQLFKGWECRQGFFDITRNLQVNIGGKMVDVLYIYYPAGDEWNPSQRHSLGLDTNAAIAASVKAKAEAPKWNGQALPASGLGWLSWGFTEGRKALSAPYFSAYPDDRTAKAVGYDPNPCPANQRP